MVVSLGNQYSSPASADEYSQTTPEAKFVFARDSEENVCTQVATLAS